MNDQPPYVQIRDLEVKQARIVRDFILGDPSAKARLQAIDNLIAALRLQLTPEQ